jgi:hypothetical protein
VDALGFHADEDGPGRFILSDGKDEVECNPVRRRREARPKGGRDLRIPEGEIERYVGGFIVRGSSGVSVWLVRWHFVYHETQSGDVAPGLGPFEAEVDEDDDGGA